jgi:hypothetical protein
MSALKDLSANLRQAVRDMRDSEENVELFLKKAKVIVSLQDV